MLQIPTPKPSLAGHVELTLVGKDGRTKFHSRFKNLILDTVFSNPVDEGVQLFGGSSSHWQIAIGADVQTPPLTTDTTLNNEIGATSNTVSNDGGFVLGATRDEDYHFRRRMVEFGEDEVIGNLTEVGLRPNRGVFRNAGVVLAKTLLKDDQGNPTVVEKKQGDVLFVSYELRIYRPIADVSAPFNIGGQDYRLYTTTLFPRSASLSDPVRSQSIEEWDVDSMRGNEEADELVRNPDLFLYIASSSEVANGVITDVRSTFGSERLYHSLQFNNYHVPTVSPGRVAGSDVVLEDRDAGICLYGCNPGVGSGNSDEISILGDSMLANGSTLSRPPIAIANRAHAGASQNSTTDSSAFRLVGVFVDPDTLVPKTLHIPAQHRLSIQLNPNGDQLVTRR